MADAAEEVSLEAPLSGIPQRHLQQPFRLEVTSMEKIGIRGPVATGEVVMRYVSQIRDPVSPSPFMGTVVARQVSSEFMSATLPTRLLRRWAGHRLALISWAKRPLITLGLPSRAWVI